MNSISFSDKINLYVMEDLIDKLGKHPNRYILKLLNNSFDKMKIQIMNDPRLSEKTKNHYLAILKDPDLLEPSKDDDSDKEKTPVVIEKKSGGIDLLEDKIDLNIYRIYQNNPQFIDNFTSIREKLMWY